MTKHDAEEPKKPESGDLRKTGSGRRTTLLALGSATVISIYSAGFALTRAAASQIESASDARRRPAHETPVQVEPVPTSVADAPVVAAEVPTATSDTSKHIAAATHAATSAPPPLPVATQTVSVADTASHAAVTTPAPVAPPAAVAPVDTAPTPKTDSAHAAFKDGVYSGWGTSRHGDIEATVEIKGGRIVSANISQCRTRYSCSRIADLIPQVVSRQSAEVDYVSGATQSSDAYYYAVLEALKKAK